MKYLDSLKRLKRTQKSIAAASLIVIAIFGYFAMYAAYDWFTFPKDPLQQVANISLEMARTYPDGPVSKEVEAKMRGDAIEKLKDLRVVSFNTPTASVRSMYRNIMFSINIRTAPFLISPLALFHQKQSSDESWFCALCLRTMDDCKHASFTCWKGDLQEPANWGEIPHKDWGSRFPVPHVKMKLPDDVAKISHELAQQYPDGAVSQDLHVSMRRMAWQSLEKLHPDIWSGEGINSDFNMNLPDPEGTGGTILVACRLSTPGSAECRENAFSCTAVPVQPSSPSEASSGSGEPPVHK